MEELLDTIDWAAELRKIEREFDGLPPEPTPAERKARVAEQQRINRQREERTSNTGVALRLALVGSLGIALAFWPYSAACGVNLFAYLGSIATVSIGGLWTSLHTWQHRMPRAHLATLLLVVWSLGLAAAEVLPRVGYTTQSASWSCGAP